MREELGQHAAQENVTISVTDVKQQLKKVANWKGPGTNGMQGYWLKYFTTLHWRITEQLNVLPESGYVPPWMNQGRTILCVKDLSLGNSVENFRPITCLPVLWKIFNGILSEKIYDHLETEELIPEELKGYRKGSRGTKDQLIIDKMVLRNCKRRKTNLAVAWID